MNRKPRLLFLIHSLSAGGAERQLCELAGHLDRSRYEIHVVVFYEPGRGNAGELWPEMASLPGVELHCLHKRRGPLGYVTALPRTLRLMFRLRPHIMHGYSDGNLPALLLGGLFRSRVVWGIRRTSRDLSKLDRLSLRLLKTMIRLSSFVDLIIFNSEAGRLNHLRMGMRSPRMHVIPNGFDVSRFRPDPALGAAQRVQWGVPAEVPLIGIVGRLDPVKDHATFLRAAARLAQEWPEARFICIGGGGGPYAASLRHQAAALGIADQVLWPGPCSQMPAAYNALSVLVLSSADEGFPNVIGEAMACGIPCAATRAGDAAALVGDTGAIAEIGDDAALSAAVSRLLHESREAREARAREARERICTLFSVHALAQNTERVLESLLPPSRPRPMSLATAEEPGISHHERAGYRPGSWSDRGEALPKGRRFPSPSRYLVRFDDICPTMDWAIWNEVESILVELEVKPILAVIPDNRDPNLQVNPPAKDFWARVRGWQSKGWAIGLHGYQHTYVNQNAGILHINARSEFAGLDFAEQHAKLKKGLDIFAQEGVRADTWVAPGHSFDWVTVSALNALGIHLISDGLAFAPYRDPLGNIWVPQQFANMRRMPMGVWTYCYHTNHLAPHELQHFRKSLTQLRPSMIALQEAAEAGNRHYSASDHLVRMTRKIVSSLRNEAGKPVL